MYSHKPWCCKQSPTWVYLFKWMLKGSSYLNWVSDHSQCCVALWILLFFCVWGSIVNYDSGKRKKTEVIQWPKCTISFLWMKLFIIEWYSTEYLWVTPKSLVHWICCVIRGKSSHAHGMIKNLTWQCSFLLPLILN